MPGFNYSSERFAKDWRYDLVEDFKTESGQNFPYAKPNGHVEWGSELKKIAFDAENVNQVVASDDGKYLAVAADRNIHIINASTFETWQVLRGHIARIDNIEFQPRDSNILVSSAQNNYGGTATPEVVLWDLAETARNALSEDEFQAATKHLAQTSIDATDAELGRPDQSPHLGHWSDAEKDTLLNRLGEQFASIVTTRAVAALNRLQGRLTGSFQSNNFSPSGSYLLFLAGSRPSNHQDERWPISVLHMPTRKTVATLDAHTGAIMWTGFNATETLIGTVAWDNRICIWDWTAAASSEQPRTLKPKYTFETDGQNWTGAFSPDSAYFAATVGTGKVHVYSMHDGSRVYSYEPKGDWMRALSWEPHRKERDQTPRLCVGRRQCGQVILLELGREEPVQIRKLGTKNVKLEEERKRVVSSFLEVHQVRYVAGGRFLITKTSGDGGVEIYDFVKEEKWRIARGGVDLELEKAQKGEIDAVWVGSEVHWEKDGKIWVGVIGGKDLRIWAIPTEED